MTTFLKVSSLPPAFGRITDSWASVRRAVHGGEKTEDPSSLLIVAQGVFQVENGAFTSYGVLERFTEPVQIPNPKIDLRQSDPARTGSFRLACPAAEQKKKCKREKIGLDTTTGLLRVIVLPSYHASGIEGVLISSLFITKYNNRLPGYNSSSYRVAKIPMHDTVEIISGSLGGDRVPLSRGVIEMRKKNLIRPLTVSIREGEKKKRAKRKQCKLRMYTMAR
jgi:hypothetical protein